MQEWWDTGVKSEILEEHKMRRVAVLSVSDVFVVAFKQQFDEEFDLLIIRTPQELEDAAASGTSIEAAFVPHWRWKISSDLLTKWRFVGFHVSPLPRGRGGSPIQNQILRREYFSEVCAFEVVAELDAGDVYLRRPIDLSQGALSRLMVEIASTSAQMALDIVRHQPVAQPQAGSPTTYRRRSPADSRITLAGSDARAIYDQVRMVDGLDYPRAFLVADEWRIEFSNARLEGDVAIATARFSRLRRCNCDGEDSCSCGTP